MYRKITFLIVSLLMTLNLLSQKAPKNFKNPILPGFYPDPSICRVGDTYYMVNSTFEWFPGVPVHRSKDLVNWEKIGYCIDRPEQIDYKDGLRNSNGIFAPTIRHHNGTFYMITTMVGGKGNFIVTAKDPAGPWSDPIWLKDAPGIDPSLFWDDDGKCYYTGAAVIDGTKDEWPGKNGVWMQEINPNTGEFLGERNQLTYGHASNARWAEGPHLYKIDGEYLLLIGEGGTGEYHSVTVFNSKDLWGPYVPNHANPVMTHRHLGRTHIIGQTGHADLVQTQNGDWWSVMLAKRRIDNHINLARETFLAEVIMTQQESGITPIFNPGIGLLQFEQKRPDLPWAPVPEIPTLFEFDNDAVSLEWNMLRNSSAKWYETKNGVLKLQLRPETVNDLSNPSFLAQRTRNHTFEASTKVSFSTKKENEKAGLVIYRRNSNHYQLLKQKGELVLIKTNKQGFEEETSKEVVARIPYTKKEVILKAKVHNNDVQFFYGESAQSLQKIGEIQDYSIISDEVTLRFNGTYIGIYATSMGEQSKTKAEFDWFEMK